MKVYLSLTDRLRTQHLAIENIIFGISGSRLLIRPLPGKWNILDNIAHLAGYQPVFIDRINQILLEEEPHFGRYKAEEDPGFEHCQALNIDALLMLLAVDRKHIYDLVTTLNETQLARIGVHKKFGPLNIVQWVEFFLLHEAHHIFTIFQLAHDVELG